jgi:PTH1 family peptidyl-tRNA hydrolase
VKLVVGLGNPGPKYAGTRHNVGFDAVDLLARRHGLEWAMAPRGAEALVVNWRMGGAIVAKPLTFMNLSGAAVVPLMQFYKIELADLLVVVDEVQLETGRIRIRPSGSAGGHNGLKSIIGSFGTDAFPRLRIGVGRGDTRRNLADHVLARFEADERELIADAIARAADASEAFIADGVADAMNRFNSKKDDGKPETGNGQQAPGNGQQATGNGKSEDN